MMLRGLSALLFGAGFVLGALVTASAVEPPGPSVGPDVEEWDVEDAWDAPSVDATPGRTVTSSEGAPPTSGARQRASLLEF